MTTGMRARLTTVSAAVVMLVGSLGVAVTPAHASRVPSPGDQRADVVHPQIRAATAAAAPHEHVEAIVVLDAHPDLAPLSGDRQAVVTALKRTAAATQAPVAALVEQQGGRVVNRFWLRNMLLVEVLPGTVTALSGISAVDRIIPNFRVTAAEPDAAPEDDRPGTATVEDRTWGVDRIRAHRVWSEIGVDGTGVRVATLDTGVNITHPDLAGKMATDDPSDPTFPGGWMEFDARGNPVASTPRDTHTHGTHVAGTIHGGAASGTAIGVAPGAEMMHGLVLPGGTGTFVQVVAAMQWALEPFDHTGAPAGRGAHIVNLSLGPQAGGVVDEMVDPVRNLFHAGVFVVAAIGNCGDGCHGSPGNIYEAVGVGSSDVNDDIASTSGGGLVHAREFSAPPRDWPDSWMTPDLSAPGVDVLSAAPGGGYQVLSGTSMATPHVAATVALMIEADPELTVADALDTLSSTAYFDDRYGPERPNSRFGAGRIDAFGTVAAVVTDTGVEGTVTDTATGSPLAGVRVEEPVTGRAATTGDDGRYRMRLPEGTYQLEFSRFGYRSTVAAVQVVQGTFTVRDVTLAAAPTGSVSGTVTFQPPGHTVPGATVRVLDVPVPLQAATGADGTYVIKGVPEGVYKVQATSPGIPPSAPHPVTVTAGENVTVDLELVRLRGGNRRVSVSSGGVPANRTSGNPAISGDGRYVAFWSDADNLVDDDTNEATDIFVHDLETGVIERVSVASDGEQSNATGTNLARIPDLSADGRYVAFESPATNLVADDTNNRDDVFVRDRATGTTERVSVATDGAQGNGSSVRPAISDDGRYVAFVSTASSLAEEKTTFLWDVFVRDRISGETVYVTRSPDGGESNGNSDVFLDISGDGRYVAFSSNATNLVDEQVSGMQVYVHDLHTGQTELVSRAPDGTPADLVSWRPAISADGRYVAFNSIATNLVDEVTEPSSQVYVKDRLTGAVELVSRAPGGEAGDASSEFPDITPDGRYVSYLSLASNLDDSVDNDRADVYLYDRYEQVTERISVAFDGGEAAGGIFGSFYPSMSYDGRYVAFQSDAANLVPDVTDLHHHIYVRDRDGADGPQPHFALWQLSVTPQPALAEWATTVSVGVKNIGDLAGEHTVTVLVDGEVAATTTLGLAPGQAAEPTVTLTFDHPGTHEISVAHMTVPLTVWQAPTCDRTMTGTHAGPLRVTGEVLCLDGARVTGPVTVDAGASLVVRDATLTGPVSADGAAVVQVSRTSLSGPLKIRGATTGVVITGSQLVGGIWLEDTAAEGGPVVVAGNLILGLLACSGNEPAPTHHGSPNTVTGRKSGQCAGL